MKSNREPKKLRRHRKESVIYMLQEIEEYLHLEDHPYSEQLSKVVEELVELYGGK